MVSDFEVFDDFVFATTQILYDFDGFRFLSSALIFLEKCRLEVEIIETSRIFSV